MARNSTGTISINRDVDASALPPPPQGGATGFVSWSEQDDTLRLRKIQPAPHNGAGVLAVLPAFPQDGDTFAIVDADGSCGLFSSVVVLPDTSQVPTPTISGSLPLINANPLPVWLMFQAYAGTSFTYDQDANQWIASAVPVQSGQAYSSTAASLNAPFSAGDVAGGTPVLFLAAAMAPAGFGLVRLLVTMSFALSAADTVTAVVETIANVTAFSGGGAFSNSSAVIEGRIETTGSPVVVTGAAPVVAQTIQKQVAAGETAAVDMVIALDVMLPKVTTAGARSAVAITLGTTAANITGITLNATAQAVL